MQFLKLLLREIRYMTFKMLSTMILLMKFKHGIIVASFKCSYMEVFGVFFRVPRFNFCTTLFKDIKIRNVNVNA